MNFEEALLELKAGVLGCIAEHVRLCNPGGPLAARRVRNSKAVLRTLEMHVPYVFPSPCPEATQILGVAVVPVYLPDFERVAWCCRSYLHPEVISHSWHPFSDSLVVYKTAEAVVPLALDALLVALAKEDAMACFQAPTMGLVSRLEGWPSTKPQGCVLLVPGETATREGIRYKQALGVLRQLRGHYLDSIDRQLQGAAAPTSKPRGYPVETKRRKKRL